MGYKWGGMTFLYPTYFFVNDYLLLSSDVSNDVIGLLNVIRAYERVSG